MPETSDTRLNRFLSQVSSSQEEENNLLRASNRISETSFHDFAHFEYMLTPLEKNNGESRSRFTLKYAVLSAVNDGLPFVWRWNERPRPDEFDRKMFLPDYGNLGMAEKLLAGDLIGTFLTEIAFLNGGPPDWSSKLGEAILRAFSSVLRDHLLTWDMRGTDDLDRAVTDKLIGSEIASHVWTASHSGFSATVNDFTPYTPGSVNYGLQTIYRQTWTPLGVQTGEIVRTLPLGPGQTEKVFVKVVNRTKTSRSSEATVSSEESSASTNSTKDSEEVITESAESFNWNASVSGKYGVGFSYAQVSAGMGGETSDRSSNQKSQLNDAMSSTASKIRRETKIVVGTESEQTFESSTTSEITNSNDELAVTYVYSKLQRQYEIATYLAEVNTVVYVAESVPSKAELNAQWFQRHADTLIGALKDPGLEGDLKLIGFDSPPLAQGVDSRFTSILDGYRAALPNYSMAAGTPPDSVGAISLVYEREIERGRQAETNRLSFDSALERMREHVSNNILHYCRAIWQAEDPDMRQMRYSKIKVPTRWTMYYLDAYYRSWAGYQPDITGPENSEPLSEVINPAGPIGFSGNYAIYYLKRRNKWSDLLDLLAVMRQPYLKMTTNVSGPSGFKFIATVSPDVVESMTYRITVTTDGIEVDYETEGGWSHQSRQSEISFTSRGGTIRTDRFRLTIYPDTENQRLAVGSHIFIRTDLLPVLEDPEIRVLRWTVPQPHPDIEADVFDNKTLTKMTRYVSGLADALAGDSGWQELSPELRQDIRENYHTYLLHDRYTRRLLIDTNNIVLNRMVDNTSTIEPFKRAHRYLDLLDATNELEQNRIETKRLRLRIESGELDDPETERTIVIDSDISPTIDPSNP